MSTREEIIKETNKLIDDCYTEGSPDYPGLIVFQRQKFVNLLFPLLDRLGVAIKVDGELPKLLEARLYGGTNLSFESGYGTGFNRCLTEIKGKKYTKTVPLIEEG